MTSQHFWLFSWAHFCFLRGPLLNCHRLCSLLTRINIVGRERIRTLRIYPTKGTQKNTTHGKCHGFILQNAQNKMSERECLCSLLELSNVWSYIRYTTSTREPFHAVRPPRFYWCSCRNRRERGAAYLSVEEPPCGRASRAW